MGCHDDVYLQGSLDGRFGYQNRSRQRGYGERHEGRQAQEQRFFNAKNDPYITFHSTKVIQTGADTFEVDGKFTIRGVTKDEKLTLHVSGAGTGSGTFQGTMAFDRKDYGMNSGIPFIKIADRVHPALRARLQTWRSRPKSKLDRFFEAVTPV